MRHIRNMKAFVCLATLLAVGAWADEPADRAAIARTIAALNEEPPREGIFTADAGGNHEIQQLFKGKTLVLGPLSLSGRQAPLPVGKPTVIIAHEPWGEATINMPPGMVSVRIQDPHIATTGIRFITEDVAVADAVFVYQGADKQAAAQTTPLVFVMKREGEAWKIAALRVVAKP